MAGDQGRTELGARGFDSGWPVGTPEDLAWRAGFERARAIPEPVPAYLEHYEPSGYDIRRDALTAAAIRYQGLPGMPSGRIVELAQEFAAYLHPDSERPI